MAFDRVWLSGLLLKLERYGIKGNLLRWLESYISNREQQLIIKDTLSLKGNLKAGVSQGSTIASLVFLIFINNIADYMLGLCRLFPDDTSVGERTLEINNLRSMVNIDLNKYYALCETMVSPEKKIVYFSTRPSPVDLFFFSENTFNKNLFMHTSILVLLSVLMENGLKI